jgi:iron-sulfur cluster repair protein YtfE (RIC family)
MKNAKKKGAAKKAATATHQKTTYEKLGSALASTAAFLASAVSKNPEADASPRATDLLVHQHRKVEKLLERLESPKVDVDATLRELADDLTAHIAIEEKLFYPAIRKLDPDLILEGLEEHAMGRFALKRLLGTQATDKALKARLEALKELMTNHHKEEESDLFPKARKAMSSAALEKLGASMKKVFDADVKRGHEAVLATFDDDLRKPVRATSSTAAKKKKKKKKTASA